MDNSVHPRQILRQVSAGRVNKDPIHRSQVTGQRSGKSLGRAHDGYFGRCACCCRHVEDRNTLEVSGVEHINDMTTIVSHRNA